MHLSSSTTSFPSTWDFNNNQQCIGGSGSHQVLFPLTNFYILGWLYNFENPFFMFFLDQLYNIVFHIACTVKLSFSCSFWCIFFSCFLPLLTVLCIYCKRFFGENLVMILRRRLLSYHFYCLLNEGVVKFMCKIRLGSSILLISLPLWVVSRQVHIFGPEQSLVLCVALFSSF